MNLNPKIIHIDGDFWDSYIYNNIFYLWTLEGVVYLYNWSNLIESCENHTNWLTFKQLERFKYNDVYMYEDTLPIDIGFHKNNMYMAVDEGLLKVTFREETNLNNRIRIKITDIPFLRLNIKNNGRVALSAGEEGLFEYNYNNEKHYFDFESIEPNLWRITTNHCLFVNWSYSSIYSTSK